MADPDAAPLLAGAVSLERQHLAPALRAFAAAARGQADVAEKAIETLAERAVLLAASPPRNLPLRLVHWR